ncbi:MAG TPA: tetratricopeptide repeat protein [Nocardioidaceae bacterium]|nr:tetratricopeptide repeat protein [Nocardioidaceae bacterium]
MYEAACAGVKARTSECEHGGVDTVASGKDPRRDGRDRPRSGGRGHRGDRQPGRTPQRGGRQRGSEPSDPERRSAEQAAYDGPPIPEQVTGRELDRAVAAQLRGLPEKLAARVARHLVAAALLMDEDPATAYRHASAARARAARIAVVREACGEAAYAAGEYTEALSELRAAKRMNGSNDYLPVMADCERALGRPDKALELAHSPAVASLGEAEQAEMTIVESGARLDRGEIDAALRTLETAPLRSRSRAPWVARLRYAYAEALLAAGRGADALEWFHRTVAVDGEQATDAAERAAELEQG